MGSALLLLACVKTPTHEPSGDSDLDCTPSTWHEDGDGDGYGDPGTNQDACDEPIGWVADASDCDDLIVSVFPGADEVCDGIDDDCDGEVDEDASDAAAWYRDGDGDGYGDPVTVAYGCEAVEGYVSDGTDCDDADAAVQPGGTELPDTEIDEDCDGRVDEIRVCQDGTGEFETIDEAVAAAPIDGAIVEVCPGTYHESISTSVERTIEIVGETGSAEDVVVDASDLGMAFDFQAPHELTWESSLSLSAMTLVGGSAGGVNVVGWGSVTMSDFLITGTSGGMALYVYAQDASIRDCEIAGNSTVDSPLATFLVYYPDALRRCHIHDNQSAQGVLLLAMPVYNSVFSGNEVAGGGLLEVQVQGEDGSHLVNNVFSGNSADVLVNPVLEPDFFPEHEIRNNVFCDNAVSDVLGWLDACDCDRDEDGQCSDSEFSAWCENPVVEYNWLCESVTDGCQGAWCQSMFTGGWNTTGIPLDLSSTSAPPFALPDGSPAIDAGDPDEAYDDVDGTRNDPGRYGGPLAYP